MINTGDKLLCTHGNIFYVKGHTYTVGNIMSKEFFEISTDSEGEYWYATEDHNGICVGFKSLSGVVNDARFVRIEH